MIRSDHNLQSEGNEKSVYIKTKINLGCLNQASAKKAWLFCFLIAALLLFGTHFRVLTLCAFALAAAYIVIEKKIYSIYMLFFIMPFSPIFKISAGTSFFTYLELLFVIMYIIRKNMKLSGVEPSILLFIFFLIINQCLHGVLNITITTRFFVFLFFLVAVVNEEFPNENKNLMLMYITGVITSSLIAMLDSPYFQIAQLSQMKQERVNGVYVTRFSGLYGDPNYYVVNLILAMALLIVLFVKKKLSLLQTSILMLFLVYFTSQTGSKSGLFMIAVVAVFFVYQLFARGHYILCSMSTAFLIFALLAIFSGKIEMFSVVLSRLAVSSAGLTSGRAENKWSVFLAYFLENPLRLVFGRSIAFFELDGNAAHNTYIDLLYELGIVGTVLFLHIIKNAKSKVQFRKRNLLNYCVLATILLMYFFLSELQYFDPPFHIAFAILVMNMDLSEKQNKIEMRVAK